MQLVLVSACLLGERVRYHGGHAFRDDPQLAAWVRQGRVRALCPEVMAGFGTPREPAEIEGGAGGRRVLDKTARVLARSGRDVTSEFAAGANAAIELARATAAQVAVLKDGSPSCASQYIADGAFAGRRVMQEGVAAAALRAIGLAVFNEHQIEQAFRIVALLDSGLSIEMAKRAAAADSAADWCI
jgi:uncharacterized protein YbbK (DUF523 family)